MKKICLWLRGIGKEIPILILFLYIGYLSVIFHNRNYLMHDYSLVFDHWWYFNHRLREFSFAQWNPFSLLGRIAVQFNYIPLSVIFSPFFIFSELTLKSFHYANVIGTFLSIAVIYLFGRLLKYGRFYSLLPVVLISMSGYRYWASFIHFATFLFLYPLATFFLLRSFDEKGRRALLYWLLFVIVLSFSLIGWRLEKIIYILVFIVLIFVVLGMYQFGKWKKMWKFFIMGIATIATTLILIGWQLTFLINSTLDAHRVSCRFAFQKLFEPSFLKWVLISIIQQPAFIFICLNLFILGLFRLKLTIFSKKIPNMVVPVVIITELILVKALSFIPLLTRVKHLLGNEGTNIILSWQGIIAIFISALVYILSETEITLRKLFSFLIIIFCGLYVAEYSWHLWPINLNKHFFFTTPFFASFVAIGAVRLLREKRTWILAVLVIYHFIAETGIFFLYEIFGIPWLAPRAALAEIPFQIILMLEAVLFLVEGIFIITTRLYRKTMDEAFKTRLKLVLSLGAKFACLLFAFLTLKMFLIPFDSKREVYREEFPFTETKLYELRGDLPINNSANEAQKNAERVRREKKNQNPFKRAYVDDSIMSWVILGYKFMPAYSQTLNTAPMYSSEIPKMMKAIFNADTKEKEVAIFRKPHPEMNPVFIAYKKERLQREGKDIKDIFDYVDTVTVFPHRGNTPVFREIMAEEGSPTPRAFLTSKVIKCKDNIDEYNYLESILDKGGLLTSQITTSDSDFLWAQDVKDTLSLQYNLEFKQDLPEHIKIHLSSNKNAYLALMDLWCRGWRAYIDGKETPIYRGYIGTRFIKIEKGEHIVDFKYQVPGLILLGIVAVIAWIAMLIILLQLIRMQQLYGNKVKV